MCVCDCVRARDVLARLGFDPDEFRRSKPPRCRKAKAIRRLPLMYRKVRVTSLDHGCVDVVAQASSEVVLNLDQMYRSWVPNRILHRNTSSRTPHMMSPNGSAGDGSKSKPLGDTVRHPPPAQRSMKIGQPKPALAPKWHQEGRCLSTPFTLL